MNLIGKIKTMSWPLKILTMLLLEIVFFFLGTYVVGTVYGMLEQETSPVVMLLIGITRGWKIALVISLAALILVFGLSTVRNRRNQIDYEKDGIFYAKDKNSGSADWQSVKEIKENYYVGNIQKTTSTVYGKIDEKGPNNVVSYKKPKGPEGNRNTLILAPMGSGKTFTYVETEVLQTILRGDSLIINDPKGEVFRNTSKFARDHGVKVRALMIGEYLPYSDFWNCLKETIDPDTERVESGRLNEFCRIYMENTDSGSDAFFFNNGVNLLTTCVGYLAWQREKDVIDKFVALYKHITGLQKDHFIDHATADDHPMSYFRDTIYRVGEENGYAKKDLENVIREIEENGSKYKYNIGEVYDLMLNFRKILAEEKDLFEAIPRWHAASAAYKTFTANSKDSVADSACQTVLLAMSIFNNVQTKEVLSRDGIVLSDINKEQCAFYLVSSDKPGASVYKPILSLFFSFFFKDAMTTFDKEEQVSSITGEPNRCKGITAMLEEFYSLGHINNFDTVMTTCRSRHIYVSVIIQHIKLLEELYGKNIQQTIISGCKTLYFLGANDPETMKFVSDFAGVASILKESHHEEGNLGSKAARDMNISTSSRPIITPDEARRWKGKVLIVRQGDQPMELQMFPWTDHWVISSTPKPGYIHFDFKQLKPCPDSMMPFSVYNKTVTDRIEEIRKNTLDETGARQKVTLAISSLQKDQSDRDTESIPVITEKGDLVSEQKGNDRSAEKKTEEKQKTETKQTPSKPDKTPSIKKETPEKSKPVGVEITVEEDDLIVPETKPKPSKPKEKQNAKENLPVIDIPVIDIDEEYAKAQNNSPADSKSKMLKRKRSASEGRGRQTAGGRKGSRSVTEIISEEEEEVE